MPTSSVGRIRNNDSSRAGVTLLEMLVVVAIIAVMVGIAIPAFASGLESIRLRSGAESVTATLNSALTQSERRQEVVDVIVSFRQRAVVTRTLPSNQVRRLDLPDGIQIVRVLPQIPGAADANSDEGPEDRHFLIYPDGTTPRIGIELTNRKGTHRLVVVDPITGEAKDLVRTASSDAPTSDDEGESK